MDAGALQLLGPVDVGGLVEAGLELDEHRHLDAPLGGPHQRSDDRAVAAGPVERHLDRLHPRVGGGLLDERLGAAGEALVGVVDEDRPVADDRHERSVGLLGEGDAPGRHRRPRPVLEVGAVEAVQLPQAAEVDRAARRGRRRGADVELADEQVEHLVAHRVGRPRGARRG